MISDGIANGVTITIDDALALFPAAVVVDSNTSVTDMFSYLASNTFSYSEINIYAAAMPTSPCWVCGATAWWRSGDGWTCGRCHPDPRTLT